MNCDRRRRGERTETLVAVAAIVAAAAALTVLSEAVDRLLPPRPQIIEVHIDGPSGK